VEGVEETILLMASTALAVFLVALVVSERPASAAFPGKNGEIAFVRSRDANEEIYVMNADDTNQTRFTDNPVADWGLFVYDFNGFYEPVIMVGVRSGAYFSSTRSLELGASLRLWSARES
jgi:hypothetical protein